MDALKASPVRNTDRSAASATHRWASRWAAAGARADLRRARGFGVLSRADALLGNEGFSEGLDFPRTLLPPQFRLAGAQPVEDFFDDTARLQAQVDALAKEE
jgi:hypothetical protein